MYFGKQVNSVDESIENLEQYFEISVSFFKQLILFYNNCTINLMNILCYDFMKYINLI